MGVWVAGLLYHRQFDYDPTMKMLYYSAILFAIICLSLAALNTYDFLYRDDLPWKEGDFKAVMLLCVGGVAVFSLIALLLRHAVKSQS